MPVSFETYERVSLEDSDEQWELVCGRLRKKPGMTTEHNQAMHELMLQLVFQVDRAVYIVTENTTKLRTRAGAYLVPDICVLPREFVQRKRAQRSTGLEVYDEVMPLVAEVWSPSTGDYDVDTKLVEYQQRGDAEIWRLHPIERTLIAWRRGPDGSDAEFLYTEGIVEPASLPGVRIELASLFME